MKRPAIAVYMPNLASGGIERMHINLAPAFIAQGYEVIFLLQRYEGALLSSIPEGVRIVCFAKHRTLACLLPLVRFLRKERPQILFSNLGHNNIIAIMASLLAGGPTRVIASYHRAFSAEIEASPSWKYRILPLLSRIALKYAHGIVAVSEGVANDLAKKLKLARSRIKVIYNPVICDAFDSKLSETIDHPSLNDKSTPFILGVGRLVEQKNFALLISAFALIAPRRNIRLVIIGEGPLKQQLEGLAQQYAVENKVEILNFQSNPFPFMRQASMLVMTSRYEGFGNVLVEALACGTSVVSTDCAYGPSEILQNGKYGKLIPVMDKQALAKSMLETLESPLPKEILSSRGRQFTVACSVQDYLEFFSSLERTPITLNNNNPAA